MQRFKGLAAALAVLVGLSAPAVLASERGTPEEAQALVEKAAAFLRENGPEVAFPAFNDQNGQFRDRDLYVLVFDREAVMMAHGGNANLVGRSQINMRDVTGKRMAAEMIGIEDRGSVEYRWQNPITKAVEPKITYVVRVGEYTVGVGAYNP